MLLKSEKMILKAYLALPTITLLQHRFELDESFLAGIVTRFLQGERFNKAFIAFTDAELKFIDELIDTNTDNKDGKDLITAVFITQAVCNILNKYQKT